METSGATTDPLYRTKKLVAAQARVESANFAPTSRAMRNKNPLNLKKYTGQDIKADKDGFCIFPTLEDGYKAAEHQIQIVAKGISPAYNAQAKKLGLKDSSKLNIRKYLYIFASSSTELEKDNYVKAVCKELALPDVTPLSYFA